MIFKIVSWAKNARLCNSKYCKTVGGLESCGPYLIIYILFLKEN